MASFVKDNMVKQHWIVTYDNVPEIRILYDGYRRLVYHIGYSARQSSPGGTEVMFFGNVLRVPPLIGPVRIQENADVT